VLFLLTVSLGHLLLRHCKLAAFWPTGWCLAQIAMTGSTHSQMTWRYVYLYFNFTIDAAKRNLQLLLYSECRYSFFLQSTSTECTLSVHVCSDRWAGCSAWCLAAAPGVMAKLHKRAGSAQIGM
jgi:hypothetical protein